MHISDLAIVLREDGPRWLAFRLWYEAQLRYGFRRTLPPVRDLRHALAKRINRPSSELDAWLVDQWKTRGGHLLGIPNPSETVPTVRGSAQADADRILNGEIRFFSGEWRPVGHPPDWLAGANGGRWSSENHWSAIADLAPDLGDIKHVWEPSRFGQAFTLARAYALTGDERYSEAFWQQVDSWIETNRPEMGPHWRCAQEMSLRSLAWIFGLYAFRESPATTPERVARLILQLWYHAYHVEKVHWYAAECVRNNHAISEAVGLFTIGTLFPFLPEAKRWHSTGLKQLEHELSWQIYEDGSYIQSSMNYSRMVVQLLTWTIALAKADEVTLPGVVLDRAGRLLRFLVALQEPSSGRVPNYGPNDGTLILPLSSCDYLDYRPALQALSLALGEGRLYGEGPWDEETAWVLGTDALNQPIAARPRAWAVGQAFEAGGYYTLRGDSTYAMIRCTTYRHRPAQADMLHLDLWYHGQNVLADPGTFSYNPPPPWSGHFAGTLSHNTVSVDGQDQMQKAARFMWLRWTKARLLEFSGGADRSVFEGEHYGYSPVVHRRRIVLHDGVYVVVDDLENRGNGYHTYRLHWLLNDLPLQRDSTGATVALPEAEGSPLRIEILTQQDSALDWVRADADVPRGWQSLYYGERLPAWSLACTIRDRTVKFVTCIGPADRVHGLLERSSGSQESLIRLAGAGRLQGESQN